MHFNPNTGEFENIPPRIKTFNADREVCFRGESVVLSWKVDNAQEVFITPIIGLISTLTEIEKGMATVYPTEDVTFTLTASDFAGNSTSQTVFIKVNYEPSIEIFCDKRKISIGETVSITWKVENARSFLVKTTNNTTLKELTFENSFQFTPQKTETIVFEAEGIFEGVSKIERITITVFHPISIISFNASRYFTVETKPITLTWEVENANKVIISGVGDVSNSNSVVINPSGRTIYTLKASNEFFSLSESIVIEYLPMPRIREIVLPQVPIANTSLYNFYGNYENTNAIIHNLFPKPIKSISKLLIVFPYLYNPFNKLFCFLKRKQSKLFGKIITQYSNYDIDIPNDDNIF